MTTYIVPCASVKDADKLMRNFINNNTNIKDRMKIDIIDKSVIIDGDTLIKFIGMKTYEMTIRGIRGYEIYYGNFEYVFCTIADVFDIDDIKLKLHRISKHIEPLVK